MRKFLIFLMALALAFSFLACGVPNAESETPTSEAAPTAPPSDAFEEKEESSPATLEEEENDENIGSTVIDVLGEFLSITGIEETVLYEENDLLITASNLTYTDYAVEIEIVIENNGSDNLNFQTGYEHIIVNGFTFPDGYMSCDVSAGKKAKDIISLDYDEMMIYGIYELQQLAIGFRITDEDYESIDIVPVEVALTNTDPFVIDETAYQDAITNLATQNEYNYSVVHFAADTFYDCKNIRVLSQCLIKNQYDEILLLMEVFNDSTENIRFKVNNIAVNDLIIYGGGYWSSDAVLPGTRNIIEVNLSNLLTESYWELYGIENIASITVDASLTDTEYEEIESQSSISFIIPDVESSYSKDGNTVYTDDNTDIIFKAIIDGERDYDDSVYILLLAENKSSKTIYLQDEYDSFSINGFMSNSSFGSTYIKPGQSALLEIEIYEYMFEDSGITEASDISDFEITLVSRDENYRELDSFTIQYTVS